MNRKELKTKLHDKIEKNIKNKEKWFEQAKLSRKLVGFINILPKLPENPSSISCDSDTIFFTFRYDKFLKTEIKRRMLDAGFSILYENKEEDINDSFSDPSFSCARKSKKSIYKRFTFRFSFDDTIENSTCKRKVIGEEMKMTKIYEWNCEEKV